MIKRKVLSQGSELFETCRKRVIIKHDDAYMFDRDECERPFRFWSTNTRECSSDKDAECPVREDEREDGTYLVNREGFAVFKVSANIHSGRVWTLGNGSHFPDYMWDVSSMGYLYTTRELWERCMGEGTWRKPRQGNPFKTFDEWVRETAQSEIDEMNLAEFGQVYGYETEERVDFKKVYSDGREIECHEWEDGEDSCWGFLTDDVDCIDFPRDPETPVFAGVGAEYFVECEYTIPEFVIRTKFDDGWHYLTPFRTWSIDLCEARIFHSHWKAQSVAKDCIPKDEYDRKTNIIEKDEVK